MAYPSENIFVVRSSDAGFDIGNTGANVAALLIPVKCAVVSVSCMSTSAVANSFTVSLDSLSGATQGAEDVGKIIVPDSAGAFASYYDVAGQGVILNAGDKILVQVDEAGDSGEKAVVSIALQYLPETAVNTTTQTETA